MKPEPKTRALTPPKCRVFSEKATKTQLSGGVRRGSLVGVFVWDSPLYFPYK